MSDNADARKAARQNVPSRDGRALGDPASRLADPLGLLPPLQQAFISFAIVFCVVYGSIVLTRGGMAIAPFWPANAILLVLLLRAPWSPARRLDLLAAGSTASIIANCLGGTSLSLSVCFTIANGVEVLISFAIIRHGQSLWRSSSRPAFSRLRQLLLAAVTAPVIGAGLAAASLVIIANAEFSESFVRWYLSAALGMFMILPLGIMDYRDAVRRLYGAAGMRSAALHLLFVAVAAFLVFAQTISPFMFLVTAAVLLATYSHRSIGVAAGVATVALIAVPLTAAGRGPLSLVVGQDDASRQLLLQAYLMAVCVVSVIGCAILDDRDGLRILAERREEAARKRAESQSDLIRHLVHEIRTPLNVIQGFAALINERSEIASDVKNMARNVVDASSEVAALANGILDQSRIESGALHLEPALLSVARIFAELRAEFSAAGQPSRLIFEEAASVTVYADALRTKQMLRNLITNAVKYAGLYGAIRVKAHASASNGFTQLEVVDQGPGIAKNRLHEVFEPFSKLGPQAASGHSAGVGLSLVKQLAEAQFGSVGVSSIPFVETRFWIYLPSAPSAEASGWHARGARDIDPKSVFPD